MITATPTGDLSAIDAFTDKQLAVEIAAADVRFAQAKLNDLRRASLAYTDAKLAVTLLTAERRRREQAAAVAAAEAIVAEAAAHICPPSCKGATSHPALCECRCRGEHHGADHRARHQAAEELYQARVERAGGVLPMLKQMGMFAHEDDDQPF